MPDKKVKPDPNPVPDIPIIPTIIEPTIASLLNMAKEGKLVMSVDFIDKDSLKKLRGLTKQLSKNGINIEIGPNNKRDN